MEKDKLIVELIYEGYKGVYGHNIQGLCGQLAKSIQSQIGGIITAGYIVWNGGERSHWWVEKDGVLIDPMGDDRLGNEKGYRHEKVHQNSNVLDIF